MSALIRQVALVSLTDAVPPATVMQISAALQKQATRDLGPIWDVSATVDSFERLGQVPIGTWPIIIGGRVPPGAGGFHTDENGQPLALVRASSDLNILCQTCSHEMLEMLVDPFGNRFVPGDSPKPDQGRVNFLVEVCDPSYSFTPGVRFGRTKTNMHGRSRRGRFRARRIPRLPLAASLLKSLVRALVSAHCGRWARYDSAAESG